MAVKADTSAQQAMQEHMYQEGRIFPDDINMLDGICISRYLKAGSMVCCIYFQHLYIPNKQDRDTSIVLRADQTEVLLQIVQAGIGNGIAIQLCDN